MILSLKQFDINQNQYYNPSIDFNNDKSLIERINKRINQINNLRLLLNENLSNEEFYDLAIKIYDIRFENQSIIRINLLSDYNLMIHLVVRSDETIPLGLYSIKEVISYFKYNNVLLEGIHFDEYDQNYFKEYLNIDMSDFKKVSEEELTGFYRYLKNELDIRNYNDNLFKLIKKQLTFDRINEDLNRLIDFTNVELNYLNNKRVLKFDLIK